MNLQPLQAGRNCEKKWRQRILLVASLEMEEHWCCLKLSYALREHTFSVAFNSFFVSMKRFLHVCVVFRSELCKFTLRHLSISFTKKLMFLHTGTTCCDKILLRSLLLMDSVTKAKWSWCNWHNNIIAGITHLCTSTACIITHWYVWQHSCHTFAYCVRWSYSNVTSCWC